MVRLFSALSKSHKQKDEFRMLYQIRVAWSLQAILQKTEDRFQMFLGVYTPRPDHNTARGGRMEPLSQATLRDRTHSSKCGGFCAVCAFGGGRVAQRRAFIGSRDISWTQAGAEACEQNSKRF